MANVKDEALKMAGYDLDGVIADVEKFDNFDNVCLETIKRVRNVIAETLEQPTYTQEIMQRFIDNAMLTSNLPKRLWQGLTDEEINELADFWDLSDINIEPFIEKVERKVKEKNHG
jgi:hypothetical protein